MSDGWITNVRVVNVAAGITTELRHVRLLDGAIADLCDRLPQNPHVVLDGEGRWLAPGLIDAHVHLFLAADAQPLATFLNSTDEQKFATATHNASIAIRAGITTVRDCGGPSALVRAFRRGPARGDHSPHLVASGSPLTRPNGHCHFMGIAVATREEVRAAAEQLFAEENEFIKIIASGGGLTPGTRPADADFPYELMCEAVAVAHTHGRNVAAHCHATESIRRAVRAGVDVIEHASFVDADGRHRFALNVCEEIRDHGLAVCPTVAGALRSADAFAKNGPANALDTGAVARLRGRLTNAAHFYRLGVKIVAGTDCGITRTPFDSLVDELLALRQAGMSTAEALRSATSDSAEFLRLGKVGEVRVGHRADLILLSDDPLQKLETLRNPEVVLKAGKVVLDRRNSDRNSTAEVRQAAAAVDQREDLAEVAQEYSFKSSTRGKSELTGRHTNEALRRPTVASGASVAVREPSGEAEFERYYDLRWRVLREPWSQQRGQERDEHEVSAVHLAAWIGDRLVGVGRLHFVSPDSAQIRYMAVEPEMQGQGIGGRILDELEHRARQRGARRIVLNARDRAVGFYRQHGYSVTHSSEALFNAIPHWEMEKILRPSNL